MHHLPPPPLSPSRLPSGILPPSNIMSPRRRHAQLRAHPKQAASRPHSHLHPLPVSSRTGVGTSTTCTLAAAARARGALASTRLALDPWQV